MGRMEFTPSYRDQIQNRTEPSWRDELYHHGIKGMKWGVRHPRNEDGIITGAGAALAKKQKKAERKAKRYKGEAALSQHFADNIQRDADAHGAKARATRNIAKKAGHRAAQLWDINAAETWRYDARRMTKKSAKQQLKADRLKAKKKMQDWGAKANARYEKDYDYRNLIGDDAERAVDNYNAARAAAKKRYRQAIKASQSRR